MAEMNASEFLHEIDSDFFNFPGSDSNNMTAVLLFLEQLSPVQLDEIMNELQKKHPQVVDNIQKKMHGSYESHLMEYDEYRTRKFILLYVPPILIILGTFGNIFSFIILKRKAMLKFSTYYYLMVLAIADTLVLYIGLLRLWIGELTGYDLQDQADWSCKLVNVVGYTISDFSVWLIIAVTVERYIVVCHPLKANSMCNTQRARKVILGLLLGLFLINCHFFWTVEIVDSRHGTDSVRQCSERQTDAAMMVVWPWVDTILYSLLPFLVIVVLNVLIIDQVLAARQHRMALRSGSMHEHAQRRPSHEGSTRLTVMLLTITFAFLVTTLPVTISNIMAIVLDDRKRDLQMVARFRLARTISELLMYINHAMNFFLYCATGQKFRHQLVWMICYSKRPYNMNLTMTEPTTQPTRIESLRNGAKNNCVYGQGQDQGEICMAMIKNIVNNKTSSSGGKEESSSPSVESDKP